MYFNKGRLKLNKSGKAFVLNLSKFKYKHRHIQKISVVFFFFTWHVLAITKECYHPGLIYGDPELYLKYLLCLKLRPRT